MTFTQLVQKMESEGCNLADVAIGRMMDIIQENTGKWPSWDDKVPEWVLKECNIKSA